MKLSRVIFIVMLVINALLIGAVIFLTQAVDGEANPEALPRLYQVAGAVIFLVTFVFSLLAWSSYRKGR